MMGLMGISVQEDMGSCLKKDGRSKYGKKAGDRSDGISVGFVHN